MLPAISSRSVGAGPSGGASTWPPCSPSARAAELARSLLLEDDQALRIRLQRFLGEHHVPYPLPLYDETGRYAFASPGKVEVLANALLATVAHGRDNELYILLVDLVELDGWVEPLLRAVKVAQGAASPGHAGLSLAPRRRWPPTRSPRSWSSIRIRRKTRSTP